LATETAKERSDWDFETMRFRAGLLISVILKAAAPWLQQANYKNTDPYPNKAPITKIIISDKNSFIT
jgi:hypothetical protein